MNKKSNAEAVKEFNFALRLNPDNTEAKLKLKDIDKEMAKKLIKEGEQLKDINEVDSAIYLFLEAYNLDSEDIQINLQLGDMYFNKGQIDTAIIYYNNINNKKIKNEKLGNCYYVKKDYFVAYEYFNSLVELNVINDNINKKIFILKHKFYSDNIDSGDIKVIKNENSSCWFICRLDGAIQPSLSLNLSFHPTHHHRRNEDLS